MSTAPPAVSAGDYFDKRVKHTMASELADLAWSIHESLGEALDAKPTKPTKGHQGALDVITEQRERLAELATTLAERAAEIDPLSA